MLDFARICEIVVSWRKYSWTCPPKKKPHPLSLSDGAYVDTAFFPPKPKKRPPMGVIVLPPKKNTRKSVVVLPPKKKQGRA